MKHIVFFTLFIFALSGLAQNTVLKTTSHPDEATLKPKLVVGIVVDQMRYDYLTRYYSRYGEGGFKRLLEEGFSCRNNHFNYIPTKTGPGHASIFTGTTPKYHGIVGNDWYDKALRKNVYCVGDENRQSVGTSNENGKMSPHRLQTTTFADENRLFTQMRGKTIAISIKDRGAILSGGHTANAAYWWDSEKNGTGNWISSSFYMDSLPQWVQDFNRSSQASSYFKVWNTLYPIETYTQSGPDLNTFERVFEGKETATFPYDLKALQAKNGGFKLIAESPYGNDLTTDFAIAALLGENLGKDSDTDVLTISYSSTDKVGHDFGPNAVEVEDMYLRLDKDLERLLLALDAHVGKGEYTVFLTSDHGTPNVPNYMRSQKIPAGLFDEKQMVKELNALLFENYRVETLILSRINSQLTFDHEKIEAHKLVLDDVKKVTAKALLKYDFIDKVYLTSDINHLEETGGYLENQLHLGHHQKRSGDMVFVYTPEVFKDTPWNRTGTDHHSGYNYDTHVPLLFYGKGIKQGETLRRTYITDIAPTLSALLGISFPNASIGTPLEFVLEK